MASWDDISDPTGRPSAPTAKSAAPVAPAPAKSGWDDLSTQAGAPSSSASAAPSGGGPAPGQPGNETLPWFSLNGNDKVGAWLNTAIDAGTGGLADYGSGKLGEWTGLGPDVSALRQNTQNLRGDIGPIGAATADLAGYAVGPGKLKVGAKLAELLAPRLATAVGERAAGVGARMLGSGAENAGASVVGTAGHGDTDTDDLVRAGTVGGLIGAVTGAIPGEKGPLAPVAEDKPGWFGTSVGAVQANSPTPGLQAASKTAFAPLETVKYDPGHFGPDFDTVTSGLSSKAKVDMGDALTGATKKISQEMAAKFRAGDTITADDVAGFQRTLGRAGNAPGAGPTDPLIARRYSDALDGAVKKAAPTDWGQMAPGTDVSGAISAANTAANKAKTSGEIDSWIKLAANKPSAVQDAISAKLDSSPQFYQTYPDLAPMLQSAADAKPGIWSKIGASVGKPLASAAIDAGANYIAGQSPLAGAIAGGLSGVVMNGPAQVRTNALVNKLAAARHLNATGQKLPTSAFSQGIGILGPIGSGLRQSAPGVGASGAFMSSQPYQLSQ